MRTIPAIAPRHLRLLLVVWSMTAWAGFARAIVISEIMYNPDGSDTDVGASKEWVELFNPGPSAIDLSGWRFGDSQDGAFAQPLAAGTSLAASEALVLTGDAAAFDAQWNPRGRRVRSVELSGFPSLANSPSASNETLALLDASGALIDSVNYDDAGPWPTDSPDGASIFLRPEALDSRLNDRGANWSPSMVGLYGARFEVGPDGGQDRASPGFVETTPQATFTPSPDAAWSMVVLPDTQAYTKSSVNRQVFGGMTQWIADRRDEFGIEFVLHVGDVVNQNAQVNPTSGDQSGAEQWANAKSAMGRLDGVVPYAISPGNHDYGATNAQDRSTQFNDFFAASDNPLVDPRRGGTLVARPDADRLDNTLHAFTAPDGREMLIAATEWGPRQASVDWFNDQLASPAWADHTAVLLTHAYMYHDETRMDRSRSQGGNPHSYATGDDTHDGEELWRELVSPNAPFEMVFSGHIGGDGTAYLNSRGDAGQSVHQMLFNTQFESSGGNGWLRVLEFLDDGRTVRVRTYSPLHDLQKTDEANAFQFTIEPLLPGDYNGNGTVDAADYTVWRDARGGAVPRWSSADGNGDGFVTEADLAVWREGFGLSRFAAATYVPEPASAALAVVIVLAHAHRPNLQLR